MNNMALIAIVWHSGCTELFNSLHDSLELSIIFDTTMTAPHISLGYFHILLVISSHATISEILDLEN